jgi:hypothetical protein
MWVEESFPLLNDCGVKRSGGESKLLKCPFAIERRVGCKALKACSNADLGVNSTLKTVLAQKSVLLSSMHKLLCWKEDVEINLQIQPFFS